MKNTLFSALVLTMLTACGASSHVLVGKQRPPISPDEVKVYLAPPAAFEQVAVLEASSAGSMAFTGQQKADKVIMRLKAEAAGLGANGLLLQGISNQVAGAITNSFGSANVYGYGNYAHAYGSGFGISTPIMQKEGSAIAIFVTDSTILPPPTPMAPSPPPVQPAPQPSTTPAPRRELDPAHRCDACGHLNDHI